MDALRMLSKSQGGADYEHEVERLLSCPICLEVYSKPVVILPCQHNLCRKCANDVFQNRGTPMGSGGRFRCPTCRYEVMLDRHGVYGLQRNLLVENIIDMYQSESKKPFRKVEVMMCEEHEDEKVNIFCVTCQKPTCSLCKVFGEHQSCTVAPVDKVFKDHKREISEAIAMLVAGNDRLQLVISRIEQLATNVEENSKTIQSDVCAAFDKLYSVLEDRKQNMLSRIKAATHEKNEVLQEMLKKYGEQLENSSTLVEESLALLEEPNVPQFLSTSRETINKVTATARATEVRKPPSNIQDMNAFVVDFSMHEAELSVIDFLDAGDENLCADDNDSVSERESTPSDVAPSTSSGGGFRAKLLLPKEEEQTEVIAEAEIKRERNDDDEVESDDTTSLTSRSDAGSSATGRRESSSSHVDLKLENDVKAIAERYLSGKSSRPSSRFGSTGDSDSRHRNYSDENSTFPPISGCRFTKYLRRLPSPERRAPSPVPVQPTVRSTAIFQVVPIVGIQLQSEDTPSASPRSNSPDLTRSLRISTTSSRTGRRGSGSNASPNTFIAMTPETASTSTSITRSSNETQQTRPRRTIRHNPRFYATHRRRTWSHLLDKK